MSNIPDQDVNEQEPENAPLEDEDLEKVTGGAPSPADISKLSQAQHDTKKGIIANFRV